MSDAPDRNMVRGVISQAQNHLIDTKPVSDLWWAYQSQQERIAELEAEVKDNDASMMLRHSADTRAIERWQDANPGKEFVWPDHADLLVWLLEQLPQTGDGE